MSRPAATVRSWSGELVRVVGGGWVGGGGGAGGGGVLEEVGDDAVLHEVQGAADLPGGQEVAGGAGGVAGLLVVFGGAGVQEGFAVAVAGAQFGVQDLADQAVVAEGY